MASVTNNIYTVENKPTTSLPSATFSGLNQWGRGKVLQFFKKIEIIFYIEKVVGPNVLLTTRFISLYEPHSFWAR